MTAADTSQHAADPRVTRVAGGFAVERGDGVTYRVLPNKVLGWAIFADLDPDLDLVQVAEGGFALGYQTAQDAIGALLGAEQA